VLVALLLALLAGRGVQAGPPQATDSLDPVQLDRMRLIWRATSVVWPLEPLAPDDEIAQLGAGLEAHRALLESEQAAPSVRGVVELDAQRAVGVWISALETVRVRQFGEPVDLRFIRVVDETLAVLEPGRALAPGFGDERRFELTQPPGLGALWSIEADSPTRVLIERVEERPPRYVAVEVEREVLQWIASDGSSEQLPALLEPAQASASRLRLDAALASELLALGPADSGLERAVQAWRMLGAFAALNPDSPPVRPYSLHDRKRDRPLPLAGTRAAELRGDQGGDYRLAEQPDRWTIEARGPGQLRIAARSWASPDAPLRPAILLIRGGGRVLAQVELRDRPARLAADPEASLPRFEPLLTTADEPVGQLASLTLPLAPGVHDYELELIGGPALIAVERTQRHEASLAALKRLTPIKQARVAERAVRKSKAAALPWLELLLAEHTLAAVTIGPDDPRFVALGQRSPLLAAAALAMVASDQHLPPSRLDGLVAQLQPWLAALDRDADLDPLARAQLRTRWLALLAMHGRPDLAPALIGQLHELSSEGLRLLAQMLVAAPSNAAAPERSFALAVLELARAQAPADRGLRGLSLDLWTSSSRWSSRRPKPQEAARWPFEPVGEWLVPHQDAAQAELDAAAHERSWTRLVPGQAVELSATLGSEAGQRLRLMDVYVATPAGEPAPVGIRVDQRRWWSPQLREVVRHRVALTPGVHTVELDGPAHTQAWASLPPAEQDEAVELARREQMWPLPDSIWALPGPALPGVVRLELRWTQDLPRRPVRITVIEVSEAGSTRERTVLFDPPAITSEAFPLHDSPAVSPRHDLSLPIAGSTTALRFEVEDDLPIAASLSLRRSLRAEEAGLPARDTADEWGPDSRFDAVFAGLPALIGDALDAELSALSHVLLADPQALDARGRRAALLLMIGETGLARADMIQLEVLSQAPDRPIAQRERAEALLRELELRLAGLLEPSEIVVTDPGLRAQPELLEPAIAAVVGDDRARLDPWLETWAQTRGGSVEQALALIDARLEALAPAPDTDTALLGALSRAHWLSEDPSLAREASRAWLELYGRMPGALGLGRQPVAVGIAVLEPLIVHLGDPASDARDASVGFGLAPELEPFYGHAKLRRMAAIAAQRSDWTTIDHSEANAGFEVLELPVAKLERSPTARVRDALLAAPWGGATSEQLRPGRKGVLAWDARPGSVTAQLWCRQLRFDHDSTPADPTQPRLAELSVRLIGKDEGVVERQLEIADGELTVVKLPITSAGRQQLELSLASDPRWMCAWRAETQASGAGVAALTEPHRRARWWTATPGSPVEFTIMGPTTLLLESRAVTHAGRTEPSKLLVEVERLDFSKGRATTSLALDAGELALDIRPELAVITERRRSFEVAYVNADTVVLTGAGPHRVTLRSDRGRLLIRARMRHDQPESLPPVQVGVRMRGRGASPADPRRTLNTPPIFARDEPDPIRNRIGTFDGLIRIGLDELGDAADLDLRFGVAATVGWRRELIDDTLWVRVAARLRTREGSPVAAGGLIGLGARVPGLRIRLGALVDVLAHAFSGRAEASVRATGFIDRPTWLSRRLLLLPRLSAGWRWQSLNPERVAATDGTLTPHPLVYQRYIHDHPLLLRPELLLRAYPFQDLALWSRASLFPDSDLRSIDHINLELGFDGIGRQPHPWLPTWGASYQASLRFDSLGQPFYVRHGVAVELGLAVWVLDTLRITTGVSNQVYWSEFSPLRDVIELWLRIDAPNGRRMRDFGPGELWYREPWAPRAWGDHEHQARSTGTR